MACLLFSGKLLHEPELTHCQLFTIPFNACYCTNHKILDVVYRYTPWLMSVISIINISPSKPNRNMTHWFCLELGQLPYCCHISFCSVWGGLVINLSAASYISPKNLFLFSLLLWSLMYANNWLLMSLWPKVRNRLFSHYISLPYSDAVECRYYITMT